MKHAKFNSFLSATLHILAQEQALDSGFTIAEEEYDGVYDRMGVEYQAQILADSRRPECDLFAYRVAHGDAVIGEIIAVYEGEKVTRAYVVI